MKEEIFERFSKLNGNAANENFGLMIVFFFQNMFICCSSPKNVKVGEGVVENDRCANSVM